MVLSVFSNLERKIKRNTKLIVVNSPHNPTEYHFTPREQERLIEVSRRNKIVILSDEVYKGLEYHESSKISPICDLYEHGICVGVMSKTFGLAGLRIGWLATKRNDILESVGLLKECTTICNSATSEFLPSIAIKNRNKLIKRNLQIIERNLPELELFCKKHEQHFAWYRPQAGPTVFLKLNGGKSCIRFAQEVLERINVLLLPGDVYEKSGFIRFGFARTNMPEVLSIFDHYLAKNNYKICS